MMEVELEELVGKTVQTLWVERGEGALFITTNDGCFALVAEGECCSESWFADFLGVDTLLDQIVTKVEEIDLPYYDVDDGRGRQEEDRDYGYRFTTKRGYADLIFRNSSNGYYGGWLSVFAVEHLPQDRSLTSIVSDWRA